MGLLYWMNDVATLGAGIVCAIGAVFYGVGRGLIRLGRRMKRR